MKKYISNIVPWYIKILIKIVLSRIPAKYQLWAKVNLFKHGDMLNIEYAFNVFKKHIEKAKLENLDNKIICELGPGDSLATALIAYSHGARTILIDAGNFASSELSFYKKLNEFLKSQNLKYIENFDSISDIYELLDICNSKYLTNGLISLKSLKENSINLIFSQAVLEHVPKNELGNMIIEFSRVLKKNGVSTHQVDLKDHLGGGLNNLRIPSSLWETKLFSTSGFYTNRISLSEYINFFKIANLNYQISKNMWKNSPINIKNVCKEFIERKKEDFMVKDFFVILKL